MEEKVTKEVAENDFNNMLRAARTDWERYCRRNGEEAAAKNKEDIIELIQLGRLTIGDSGFPTFCPFTDDEDVSELSFHRMVLGSDIAAGNRSKGDDEFEKFYHRAGQYFKKSPSKIRTLEVGDIVDLMLLWNLFSRI